MRRLVQIAASCLFAIAAFAQTPAEWSIRGDEAAQQDRHRDAIEAYRRAIELDPALGATLRVRLARQHLWAGENDRSVALFEQHLEQQPADCEARSDYGLALAWSDRLTEALTEYRTVAETCPGLRDAALLREAMVLRWRDRPAAAREIYAALVNADDSGVAREAQEGLGFADLLIDANRAARARFASLAASNPSTAATDGLAIAQYRLGNVADARDVIAGAAQRGELSRDLEELNEAVQLFDRWQLRAGGIAFRDGDGTEYRSVEAGASKGWRLRGRGEVAAGWSTLSGVSREIDARWAEVGGEYRWTEASAVRARLRATDYDTGWTPWSGELHWIATPRDELRVDLTAARILVIDTVAAIENRLHGDFLSAGVDRTFARRFSVSASADVTNWSEGNRRIRLRVAPARIFEGVPRVTVEWPTLVQHYDEPFVFALWSPERYVETGPGVNVYRRWRRVWNLSAYARIGMQREDSSSWRWLGVARVLAERDLRDAWSLRVAAGWSNSSLAGSSGFRRTSVELELRKRF